MKRLTTDTPKDNLQNALNLFYVKDHEAYVRGGGPAPDYKDVSLNDYMKRIIEAYNLDIPSSAEDLPDAMYERLFDGTETLEGLMATLYTAAWAFAEIRHRLSAYEDTDLTPEEIEQQIDDLEQELEQVKAERDALALIVKNLSACTHCKHVSRNVSEEPCADCNEDQNYPNWEWHGAKDTNVPGKEEE